jgi:hypothetical protein
MKVAVAKQVIHMKLGRLDEGRIMEFPDTDPWLQTWLRDGVLERYETKVLRENPCMAVGKPERLSASPAAQV